MNAINVFSVVQRSSLLQLDSQRLQWSSELGVSFAWTIFALLKSLVSAALATLAEARLDRMETVCSKMDID